jgi:hypothetical protein
LKEGGICGDECSAGTFFSEGKCLNCSPGWYSQNAGSISCLLCDGAGEYQNESGGKECLICGEGKEANKEHTDCVDCGIGRYSDGGRESGCVECSSSGTYSKTVGRNYIDMCDECGKYENETCLTHTEEKCIPTTEGCKCV